MLVALRIWLSLLCLDIFLIESAMNESKKTSSKDSQRNSSNTLLEQLFKKLGMDELKIYL